VGGPLLAAVSSGGGSVEQDSKNQPRMASVSVSGMHLYSLTLQPSSAITQAVVGQFSGKKIQEVLAARGSRLELFRPDIDNQSIGSVLSQDTFSTIRSIVPFRLTGQRKDFVIVGSDSGILSILELNGDLNAFVPVKAETFGKSGVRRVVPGQYLAVDPIGRAVMVASIEKNKLIYILNRTAETELSISSPLEAHQSHHIIFSAIAMDVGDAANPVFAALEVDYGDSDENPQSYRQSQKLLTYYEVDLGLNHVVKKWSDVVDRSSNLLIPVPGGLDGPSGVLVCKEDAIVYRHMGVKVHTVLIPKREGVGEDPSLKRTIISAVVHKTRSIFFMLVQSDDGDLFKLSIDHENGVLNEMKIKYFDTVPIATSLCILKSGFLFVASESGNHMFYQFEKLGDDDDEAVFSSIHDLQEPARFSPRPLINLSIAQELYAMNPLMDCKVLNLTNEDAPQLYTLSGKQARSSLRILRHGLDVNEYTAATLPGTPTAVWTTKLRSDDEYDAYIVLSFSNGSLILSIGETVEEVQNSGFLSSVSTLAVQQMGEDALLQIHSKGIRHIRADKKVNEWKVPQHCSIVAASTNNRQVAVALSTQEIVYFEMDNEGQLNEFEDRKETSANVLSLSVGEIPYGRVRSAFLAVGCDDLTVRIISLEPENPLDNLSIQALSAAPSSLRIMSMFDSSGPNAISTLYLHIGLVNGVYLRTVLDTLSGQLSDTRTRFLGPKAVKIFQVRIQERPALLGLSSRPWLGYTLNSTLNLTPLSYEPLEYASSFRSEQCPDGMVGIQGPNLR